MALEAVGVVAHDIDPGGKTLSARAYERTIVSCRCESHLEESIGQPRWVEVRVQLDEAVAHAGRRLVRNSELEFLVEVINRAVKRTVTLQHKV
jgi:hypothetical protein